MVRIGFDPMLEAELRNKEIIKQAEHYRLINDAMKSSLPKASSAAKLIALIGREMASLGASLEAHYGGSPIEQINLDTQNNPDGCMS
jgi:hypothetical protein